MQNTIDGLIKFIKKRENLKYNIIIVFFILVFLINITSVPHMNDDWRYTLSFSILILSLVFYVSVLLIKENYRLLLTNNKRLIIILFLILSFGFILRFYNLTEGGIHSDEVARLDRGRQVTLFHDWSYAFKAPPLTRILVGTFSLLGGTDPLNIELYTRFFLGTLTSTLTILIVFFTGCWVANRKVGLLSAFFLAFSFEHLRLSRTFMSEPYLTYFVALTILSFFMSLEKPKYTYVTMIALSLVVLTKMTGFALVPFIVLAYVYYTYRGKFSPKQLFFALFLPAITFTCLYPYLISTGDFIGLFFGPVKHAKVLYEGSQPTPWLYHFKYLFTYDKLLFLGAILTFIMSVYRKEKKPLLMFFAGISMILFVTFITHQGNMLFHRHLTTATPLFVIMAGYSSYYLYEMIKKSHKSIALVVISIFILFQPYNIYSDTSWMHYTANAKDVGLDISKYSGSENVAVYLYSTYDTRVYSYILRFYNTKNYRIGNVSGLLYIPHDMLNTSSEFASSHGVKYLLYTEGSKSPKEWKLNTEKFEIIKEYSEFGLKRDRVYLLKYLGARVYLGESKTYPRAMPFTVVDSTKNRDYIWIEAENSTFSYGLIYKDFNSEYTRGLYGVVSGGRFHWVRNVGSYSEYSFQVKNSDIYTIWIRLGGYTPIRLSIDENNLGEISRISSQFTWYKSGPVYLSGNTTHILRTYAVSDEYSIYDAILITDDLTYIPIGYSQPIKAWGRPNYTIGGDIGYYIWQDDAGWHIRWTSPTLHEFKGSITNNGIFENVRGYAFEENDYTENDNTTIKFSGVTSGDEDGIDFKTTGTEVTFDIK